MRGEKYVAPAAAILSTALALGGAACGGAKEGSTCLSPRAESQAYSGDYPEAQGSDPANWPKGILIKTRIPAAPAGVVFSFETPGSNHWKSSDPLPPKEGYAVALRIGPSPVEFGTQIQAPASSQACQKPPDSTFGRPETFAKVRAQSSGYEPDPTSWSYNK